MNSYSNKSRSLLARTELIGLALLATSSIAAADTAVVTSVSTLGLGFELHQEVNEHFVVRGAANGFSLDYSVNAEDQDGNKGNEVSYQGNVRLLNAGGLVDWYPTESLNWRLSGGVYLNDNRIRNDATCSNPTGCEFGNTLFVPAVLGTVTADITFNRVAPYLGVGYGNPVKDKGWSFVADLGAFFQGSPQVELTSSGSCNDFAACRANLEQEEREIEESVEHLSVLPVARLGVGYHF